MPERYQRVNHNGLVRLDRFADCEPKDCHLMGGFACYISKHHLYHSREKFSQGLAKEFRECPENIIPAPRCRHDTYHKNYFDVAMPRDEVMASFVDESRMLGRLGVLARHIDIMTGVLENELAKNEEPIYERWQALENERLILIQRTQNLEVIPLYLVRDGLIDVFNAQEAA